MVAREWTKEAPRGRKSPDRNERDTPRKRAPRDVRCPMTLDKTGDARPMNAADLAKQLGDLHTELNIVWTLLTGFMVMFMQAGFALVETGLTRARTSRTPWR